jgi:predicted house-cleaning noncanonical NTP pyrophosphatase (MazG superfamily)
MTNGLWNREKEEEMADVCCVLDVLLSEENFSKEKLIQRHISPRGESPVEPQVIWGHVEFRD